MSGTPYFERKWFEPVFLVACCLTMGFLFFALMPPINANPTVTQMFAMAKLFAEGRFVPAFSHFNMPPVYPMLLALIIRIKHSTDLIRLIEGFRLLNLVLGMLSIGLVYVFVRRQIPRPYTFIITALYSLAPPTLVMAWSFNAQMVFMLMSLAALIAIDVSLSRESALGGELSRGEVAVCGLFLGLSVLSWQVGYLLMLAFFFVMWKRFGFQRSALVVSIIILCISPFIGRDIYYAIRRPGPYMTPTVSIVKAFNHQGLVKTIEVYADHIMTHLTHTVVGDLNITPLDQLAQTPKTTGPSHIAITQQVWLRWVIGLSALVGAIYGLQQYTGVSAIYLCTYVICMFALLPNGGLTIGAIMPLLLFYLYYGFLRVGEWMCRVDMPLLARIMPPILTAWILLCTLSAHLNHFHNGRHSPLFNESESNLLPGSPPLSENTPGIYYMNTAIDQPASRLEGAQTLSAHRRAMGWLEAHTSPSARVGTPRPEMMDQLTKGKRSARKSQLAKNQVLQAELNQYDYLVEEGAVKLPRSNAGSGYGLKLVYEDIAGRIRIWQIQHTS